MARARVKEAALVKAGYDPRKSTSVVRAFVKEIRHMTDLELYRFFHEVLENGEPGIPETFAYLTQPGTRMTLIRKAYLNHK